MAKKNRNREVYSEDIYDVRNSDKNRRADRLKNKDKRRPKKEDFENYN